jgi:hypothetical protein
MPQRQYHIAFGSPIDAAKTARDAEAGTAPRHFMLEVGKRLHARLWEPDIAAEPSERTLGDRIAAIRPSTAAQAEALVATVGDNDVVFCNSEGASLPIADRLSRAGKRTKLASFVHNLLRPRITALRTLTPILKRHDALFVVSQSLAGTLSQKLRAGVNVQFIREQTDDQFFSPGEKSGNSARPVVVSVGMEQRDYGTLAEATGALDVDIRISGFSKDTRVTDRALPATLPENMDQRFYEWRDLAQLYRDADIVVAPVFENSYAAGITTILEGMAARRPVIATRSTGLAGLFPDDAVRWVPPGDAEALKREITNLLGQRTQRDALVERATTLFEAGHTLNGQAADMAERLRVL